MLANMAQVDPVVHLTTADAWASAVAVGELRAPSLDTEGFIHCSSVEQVVGVANRFYVGQTDLVLLIVDPDLLSAPLRWEHPAHPDGSPAQPGEPLFPHLYGPLNADAVIAAVDFPPDADGRFNLPNW